MGDEEKKSPAERALAKAEAKARAKAQAALVAWLPIRLAQIALAADGQDATLDVEVNAADTLVRQWGKR